MQKACQLVLMGVMALLPWQAIAADAVPAQAPASASGDKGYTGGWKKMDPDGKGYVTRDEWLAHSAEKFKEIDTNGDGKITKEEMDAYHEKMRKQYSGRRGRHIPKNPDDSKQ